MAQQRRWRRSAGSGPRHARSRHCRPLACDSTSTRCRGAPSTASSRVGAAATSESAARQRRTWRRRWRRSLRDLARDLLGAGIAGPSPATYHDSRVGWRLRRPARRRARRLRASVAAELGALLLGRTRRRRRAARANPRRPSELYARRRQCRLLACDLPRRYVGWRLRRCTRRVARQRRCRASPRRGAGASGPAAGRAVRGAWGAAAAAAPAARHPSVVQAGGWAGKGSGDAAACARKQHSSGPAAATTQRPRVRSTPTGRPMPNCCCRPRSVVLPHHLLRPAQKEEVEHVENVSLADARLGTGRRDGGRPPVARGPHSALAIERKARERSSARSFRSACTLYW